MTHGQPCNTSQHLPQNHIIWSMSLITAAGPKVALNGGIWHQTWSTETRGSELGSGRNSSGNYSNDGWKAFLTRHLTVILSYQKRKNGEHQALPSHAGNSSCIQPWAMSSSAGPATAVKPLKNKNKRNPKLFHKTCKYHQVSLKLKSKSAKSNHAMNTMKHGFGGEGAVTFKLGWTIASRYQQIQKPATWKAP